MAWTTPKTWSSEPLTSNDLNTYIRDNQNEIKSRLDNQASYQPDELTDYTTTSASFVAVDTSNLALSATTTGGQVLCWFSGVATHSGSSNRVYFDVEVDGTRFGLDDGIICIRPSGANAPECASFLILITGLSNGSHTFKLMWKTNTPTATLWAGAGTTNFDLHPQFGVKEV